MTLASRLLALLAAAFALCGAPSATGAETRDPYTYFFNPTTGDLRADLADARQGGKKAVFFMYEQEGCPGCKHMREHVLNRPEVQKFYRANFLNFSIDIYSSVPVTAFSGKDFTEKSYAQSQNVKGTPTLVFHDLDGREITRILGVVQEPEEFLLLGEFVASGAYKSRKFADYKQELQRKKGS